MARIAPLRCVALVGRACGEAFYWLDSRHRKVALRNLSRCFGHEKSASEIRWIARENFRRIGESFASALKMPFIDAAELRRRLDVKGQEFFSDRFVPVPRSRILVLGHFGNFELLAHMTERLLPYQTAVTYRGLRYPNLEGLMKSLRERSGCRLFERRSEGSKFKTLMRNSGMLLGLIADQHAGTGGLRLPFLGEDCSTGTSPAVFALRFGHPLHALICYRVGLARWSVEISPEIPTTLDGESRTVGAIMADVNQAFEQAVRRDPANWFWVHNRWKAARARARTQTQLCAAPG